ncbi:MAG: PQQ-dependent sugar dehydrogenase [Hyphomicrobiaceae bacterium]
MRHVLVILFGLGLVVASFGASAKDALPNVKLELVAEGLHAPIFLVGIPDGSGRRVVGDQVGVAHVLAADGTRSSASFIDLRDRMTPLLKAFDERGLLALTFHPEFARNGLFYVNYSAKRRSNSPFKGKTAYTWRLSEFKVDPTDPNRADLATERVLLELDWVNRKHNGGGLAFGPDGFLYVGVGDGGGVHGVPDVYIPPKADDKDQFRHAKEIKEDPYKIPERFHHYDRFAQDTTRLNGKILRIDVNTGQPGYAIPPSNYFRGKASGRDEIYAWGFRNPFRISFDRAGGGAMIVSGVGESLWETIYLVDRAGNYGWAVREGRHCFVRARAFDPPADCPKVDKFGETLRDPIVEYPNWSVMRPWSKVKATPLGTANVGGFIYRGQALPEYHGKLIFGDFSAAIEKPSGQVFVATRPASGAGLWSIESLLRTDQRLHSLGEDGQGELYLLTTALGIPVGQSGKVWKLVRGK